MKTIRLKKKIVGLVSIAMLAIAVTVPIAASPKNANAWVCDDRNVMICGAADRNDIANKINNGDGTHTDLKTIFNAIGIYPDDIKSVDAKGGLVKKDGTIWVNGVQVASGAIMGQRGTRHIESSNTPWVGLNWAFTQFAFDENVNEAGAYVYMRNGHFLWAVLPSCGNPILISLNGIPPHITINKTVRNMTSNPNSEFTESVSANVGDTVEFKIKIFNDSQVTTEDVNLGDYLPAHLTLVPGSAKAVTRGSVNGSWQNVTINFTDSQVAAGRNIGNVQPGSDAYLLVDAKVNNDLPSGCSDLVNTGFADAGQTNPITDKASVNVCVQGPPPPPPPTPPVTPPTVTPSQPTSLPVSGPVETAAGVMGTGALGYAGYLWRRSRKNLLDVLKNK